MAFTNRVGRHVEKHSPGGFVLHSLYGVFKRALQHRRTLAGNIDPRGKRERRAEREREISITSVVRFLHLSLAANMLSCVDPAGNGH